VMSYNLSQSRSFFSQVKPMLKAYEKYFGKYPFARDGFALVESIYPMEHQSGVCVGKITATNGTGYNPLVWHESAHEWWGNAVSCSDMADLWLHEAFATYAEALVIEQEWGKEQAVQFLSGQRSSMGNHHPIIGVRDVNHIYYDIGDMYGKGSLVLHTLRNVLDNDSLWFDMLRGIQERFRYKTITSQALENFIIQFTGKDLTSFFDQYLRQTRLPELHYRLVEKGSDLEVQYRWDASVPQFNMPVKVTSTPGNFGFIYPDTHWQTIIIPDIDAIDFEVDEDNFLIEVNELE
jgi:aminopeptidase N